MDGEVHSPYPEGFLDGITRRSVIAFAGRSQMKVVERRIEPDELARPTEVFVTGAAAEVTAVREIGPHRSTPGWITETLMKGYNRLVLKSLRDVALMVA
jgi:branched-chain amino acid aminotransferase